MGVVGDVVFGMDLWCSSVACEGRSAVHGVRNRWNEGLVSSFVFSDLCSCEGLKWWCLSRLWSSGDWRKFLLL